MTDLRGAGPLPEMNRETSSAAEFAARWNAMEPRDRETFYQAIRMSDLEWLKWRETRAEVQAYVKSIEAQRDQAQQRHADCFTSLQNARITLAEDKAYIKKLESRLASPGEHDHEFEDCCVICGKTWHEVN